MTGNKAIDKFLSQYSEQVLSHVLKLRELILKNLPEVREQIDLPAKMIACCYEQKYAEIV